MDSKYLDSLGLERIGLERTFQLVYPCVGFGMETMSSKDQNGRLSIGFGVSAF